MLKISQLRVNGYRSLRGIIWQPARLNILIGTNGSGKSNLLQCLRMLSASANGDLRDFILSQGGIYAVSFDGGGHGPIAFVLTRDDSRQPSVISELIYTLDFEPLQSGGFSIRDEILRGRFRSSNHPEEVKTFIERAESAVLQNQSNNRIVVEKGSLPPDQTSLSLARSPGFPLGPIISFQHYVATWRILDDFHTDKDSPVRQANVIRLEERLKSDGQNLVPFLHTLYSGNREFKQAVDEAMAAAFGDEYEELTFTPAGEQRIQLAVRWAKLKRPQTAASLSDGTLRFLFLITALAQPNPPALIAIDEPETGLHPSMMRIIAEYAQEASRHTQVVLTTHSPALLDAFTDAEPTVTVCELKDGATVLKNLDSEALKYWLSKYSLGELQQSGQLEAMQPAPEAA